MDHGDQSPRDQGHNGAGVPFPRLSSAIIGTDELDELDDRPVPVTTDPPPTPPPTPTPTPTPEVAPPPRRSPLQLRALDPDDKITRLLCAGAYLQGSYASHVTDVLLAPSPQAICPPWGVDALWLARHAAEAKRLRVERDRLLMFELAVVLIGGAGALALLLIGALSVEVALTDWALLWLAGYVVAFMLVFRQYRTARRTAISLAYDPAPPEPPPLADAAQELRLDELREANTVVFAKNRMFVGSGRPLDHATMTVDVSKGTKREDGKPDKPRRFDALDLHRELLKTVPRGMKPKPLVGQRLYVRSGSRIDLPIIPHGPVAGGLPEEMAFRRPVSQVPEDVLEDFVRQPDDTARVYAVFEQRGWGGQVAVTLFVRIRVVKGRTLFVELDVLAQKQLRSVFKDVTTIRMQDRDELPTLIRSALPIALPLLLGSARRRWESQREDRQDAKNLREVARSIARHRDVDLGASSSLREDSAGQGVVASDRFPWADEDMYCQMLSARVLDCIKDFLVRMGVDTSSFERQQITFVENTTIKARDIYGTAVSKGGVNRTTRSSSSDDGGGD